MKQDDKPVFKQIGGSVVSSNPEHMAFSTDALSNFPKQEMKKKREDRMKTTPQIKGKHRQPK